jgi:TamB, inner membrane protein subunit of TAM complex
MKLTRGQRVWPATAVVLLCIVALFLWQWQNLARLAIGAAAAAAAHVDLSFENLNLGLGRAVFHAVRVTSFRGEPIASIDRLSLAYDLRDLVAGRRLFGLTAVEADTPHVTIIRRPDGTYNVPIPPPAKRPAKQAPLTLRARVHNGSIEIIDQSRNADPLARHLYAERVDVDADLSMASRSSYRASLVYGERSDRLYPVRGTGSINANGLTDQHWTADALPVAGAVNFAVNSPAMRLRAGTLRGADLRYFAVRGSNGPLPPQLAATGVLEGARIAIAGLAKSVDDVHGIVDVFGGGLLTPRLDADLAGVPVRVSGGLYGLSDPHLRLIVRGSGNLTRLRSAFVQAQRLPMRGPLNFTLLIEGRAVAPVTWIALQSPGIVYGPARVENPGGLIAFNGSEADIVRFGARYAGADVRASGSIALGQQSNALEMLLGVRMPPDTLPYAAMLVPGMRFNGTALAQAGNLQRIGLGGVLSGTSATERLDALFNVDSRGSGSIGPLLVRGNRGSIYARIALDHPHDASVGLLDARNVPIAPAKAVASATLFGEESKGAIAVGGNALLQGTWGRLRTYGTGISSGTALAGNLFGGITSPQIGHAGFGAMIAGPPLSPRIAGTLAIAGGRYRNFDLNGNAAVAFSNSTLRVHDAAVGIGPLLVGMAGTIGNLVPGTGFMPRYDLAAQLHSSDARALLEAAQPRVADLVQGSIDANVRVGGAGHAPLVAGSLDAPEGSVNGLAFRDLRASFAGDPRSVALSAGHVIVGSTAIAFDGQGSTGGAHVSASASQVNLADFNDFFDAGDTFAGTGNATLAATLDGTHLVASDGTAFFSGARFRKIRLGNVAARWRSAGRSVIGDVALGDASGQLHAAGTIAPATMTADLSGSARDVDLGTWLPMLGFGAPVTGRLNADAGVAGSYPDLSMRLHAALFGGTAGRIPIQRFEVNASAWHGLATIRSAVLEVPSLSATASGEFGLLASDRLALVVHGTSPNVGSLLETATGKDFGVSGSLDSTLHVSGTRAAPQLSAAFALSALRYGNLLLPRVSGVIGADRRSVTVSGGEIAFQRGTAQIAATAPIRLEPKMVAPASGPISASLTASDIELAQFANLFPKGTQLNGRIDGNVTAGGTLASPQLRGSLELRDGEFRGPLEKSPITGAGAQLTFTGMGATLQSSASVGGGTLSAQGSATLANLYRPADLPLTLQGRVANARLDIPNYFAGVLNGSVNVARAPGTPLGIGGDVTVSSARIPLDAFLSQRGEAQRAPHLPEVAFDKLRILAGHDVRVQSANVDIGAEGSIVVGGTLRAPTLSGSFSSTGGTLSFLRTFNLESGSVQFQPSAGLIPNVNAVATTFVTNPATAVRLHVTGPATNMNLNFVSDPPYSREQILGILVGAQQFGAVQGVQATRQNVSAISTAQNIALGQVNTLFTRTLLQPLSASLGGATGANVQLTTDIQTGLGVSAARGIGRYVNAIFSQTFGYPRTQSIAFEANPTVGTGLRLTFYTSTGPTLFAVQQPQAVGMDVLNLNPLTSFTPAGGTNGVSFSFQKKFP